MAFVWYFFVKNTNGNTNLPKTNKHNYLFHQ